MRCREPSRDVEIGRPDDQPSMAEVEEDMRVNGAFEEAVDALVQPVCVCYIDSPKSRE